MTGCRPGEVARVTAARIDHDYQLYRGTELLTEAHVTMCCVDRQGVPQRLPEWLGGPA